jgi:hypothetical protein
MTIRERIPAELAVFALLMCALAVNGYPFLHADSLSYMGLDPTFTRSPVLAFVTRPLFLLVGVWGSALLQAAIGSVLIVAVARRISSGTMLPQLFLAALISGLPLLTGQILADVWLLFGVLAIYLIATGWRGPVGICVVALCMAAHYGNFLVLPPLMGLALWLIGAQGWVTSLLRSAATVVLAVLIVMSANLFWGAPKLFGSSQPYSWLGAKIIYKMPEVLEAYCLPDPPPALCRFHETFDFIRANGGAHHIIWDDRSPRKDPAFGPEAFEAASRELTLLSLHYPIAHLEAVLADVALLMRGPWFLYGYDLSRDLTGPIAEHLPRQLSDFQAGLQARLGGFDPQSAVSLFMGRLVGFLLVAGLLLLVLLLRRPATPKALISFGLYAYLALLINDLVFAAISGPYPRYHYRLVFPPLLFVTAAAVHWFQVQRSARIEALSDPH